MIEERLAELADPAYRGFQAKLIPNIPPESVLGVRLPDIRKLAKDIGMDEAEAFMHELPHKYYDENMLHGVLISNIRNFDGCMTELERFLPYVDNWAVCDTMSPKCFAKRKAELLPKISEWIASPQTYTIRFGIGMLMRWYLDGDFEPRFLACVAEVRSSEYYVNMMIAWYFATALAKQWDHAVKYIEDRRLDKWTHNKAIQKACESYRITFEEKEYLKKLRI